jgi:cytochrome c oxidase subunit 2
VIARLVAQQYSFEPPCIVVPAETPVTFRGTSTDVVHGFIVGTTNANVMLVPGFVATFTTTFPKTGEHLMPCHEYCGTGHEAMWARVQVIAPDEFLARTRRSERVSCVSR